MNQKMMTTVSLKKMNSQNLRTSVFFSLIFGFLISAHGQLQGAWESIDQSEIQTIIFSSQNFSSATYQVKEKMFIGTFGGSYQIEGRNILLKQEFNTLNSKLIGNTSASGFRIVKDLLTIDFEGKTVSFKRLDSGLPGRLSGAWLITGRMVDGKISSITPGARRTMKILSGTRFQWIAYNVDTKEFFGTGGGEYETINNRYTEKIQFFSRDSSRTGTTLSFDYSIEEGRWHHSGLSSKGDPIDEYWSLRESIGF
jgi:hypothetical protein